MYMTTLPTCHFRVVHGFLPLVIFLQQCCSYMSIRATKTTRNLETFLLRCHALFGSWWLNCAESTDL